MEALSTVVAMPLYWIQPKTFERRFELRAGDSLIATLCFETAFGTLATAESADGSWTFKRVGFLNPRVTVREVGVDTNLAVYQPRFWGDGSLEFRDGRVYRWRATNFWGTQWGFADSDENQLFALKPGVDKPKLSDLLKTQALVEIEPQGHTLPELPLLVLLGWYLMILHHDDTAAIAATTTVTAAT
jgi:hypothetical protein